MPSLRIIYLSFSFILAALSFFFLTSHVSASGPLRVSSNGRFLVDGNGSPFFWLGDTAWWLPKLNKSEIAYYLDDRAQKAFNVVQIDLNTYAWNGYNGNYWSWLGESPYDNGDMGQPNEAYWQKIDWVVSEAESRSIYTALVVSWGLYYRDLFGSDTSKAYRFGQWLGKRYRNRNNVIWIVAGEYDSIDGRWGNPLTSDQMLLIDSVGQGLNAGHGRNHLMTIHPDLVAVDQRSSSWEFSSSSWLDFNMLQSGHLSDLEAWGFDENHTMIDRDYALTPARPVVDGEPQYENSPDALGGDRDNAPRTGDDSARRKAYWAVFAGAFGHTYGHRDVQVFYIPGEPAPFYSLSDWRDAINAPGAGQMKHLKSLMESRSFLNRVQDQTVVVSGIGSGLAHIRATRAANGSYAMIYIPDGRTVTVDMTKLNGSVQASWFDPRTGSYSTIGQYSNSGSRNFDPPGSTQKSNDWVLVLDSIGAPAPPPAPPTISPR